jgi:hypothetical protein
MRKIILILLLLLLCSCTTEKEDAVTSCPPGCSGGDAGVVTTINSPRDEVYAGTRMPMNVKLEDVGESSVEEGMVCVTGLNEEVFSDLIGCNCESFYITIDDPDSLSYLETSVDFGNSPYAKESSEKERVTFITKYKYSTYGVFDVCLTRDLYEETKCSVDGNKLTTSSSGPLKVSSIEEVITPVGNTIDLKFKVEVTKNEASNEQLISLEDISSTSCMSLEEPKVEVSVVLFNEAHDCGYVGFDKKENTAEVTCNVDGIISDYYNYKKEYEGWIRLDYGWQEINSIQFDIIEE